MRNHIFLAAIVMLAAFGSAFAASGNKPPQTVIPFRNVSSSTKPAGCVQGEMKRNASYIFLCSTSARWRRIAIGNGF